MHFLKPPASIAVLFAFGAITSSQATAQGVGFARNADKVDGSAKLYDQVKAKPAGSCGTHMYWKKGKCLDARSKK
jgi:hypothetical protein